MEKEKKELNKPCAGPKRLPYEPDDPKQEPPSRQKDPPPDFEPNKIPPPIQAPPERKPFLDLIPLKGGMVNFAYGWRDDEQLPSYLSEETANLPTWTPRRMTMVLFLTSSYDSEP